MKTILITGAGGFIGGFLVEAALAEGYEVWAGVRAGSSRRYLTDSRLHFITLDVSSEAQLEAALRQHAASAPPFDGVIHAAGITKARRPEWFHDVNAAGTERLARLLLKTQAMRPSARFVFLSSLSVCGPARESDHLPITLDDFPVPDTAYGRSKWAAEQALARIEGLHYVILRPTGVYGPHEQDYRMMMDAVRRHLDVAVGFHRQTLTFIYVKDVVAYALQALTEGQEGKAYFLSDGDQYDARDFGQLIARELGVRWVLPLRVPLCVLHMICVLSEAWSHLSGRMTALNRDKFHILRQRNWQCDLSETYRDFSYRPQYPLERGVAETVDWYKSQL